MKQACRATRFLFLGFGMNAASWVPIAPFIKQRLGFDEAQFGLMLLFCGIGPILLLPLSNWLVKRFGSHLITILAGSLMLVLLPLLILAPTLLSTGLILFFSGSAGNTMNIAINTQAVTVESRTGQPLMSGFHCVFSLGNLLVVTLIGMLLELNVDLFYCALIISSCMALIMISQGKYLLRDKPSAQSSKESKGALERGVIGLGLVCLVAFMSDGCVLNWSAEFLKSSLHYPASRAGMGYMLFSIAMILGRLLGDKLITRFGPLTIFQISCLIGATGFVIASTTLWPYAELIGFALVGLGAANIVPILLSASGKFRKTSPNHALSIVTFFGYVGSLIGPPIVGFIANSFSLALAFGCMSVVLFTVGLLGSPGALKTSKIPANT